MARTPARGTATVLRPLSEANQEPGGQTIAGVVRLLHAIIRPLTKRDWRHQEKLPQTGGLVVVANHISNVDPLSLGQFIAFSGRWPRFLGKASVFKVPVVGRDPQGLRPDPGRAPIGAFGGRARRRHPGRRRRAGGDHLPRGHDHRRPRPVADGRQDRGGTDRPADRLPGDPGRAVGGTGRDVRQSPALPETPSPQDFPADRRRSGAP